MGKLYYDVEDTIEGEASKCIAMKIEPVCLISHPITNEYMYSYRTDKNSKIINIKDGIIPTDDQLAEKTKHFHRQKNDGLKADAIRFYVSNIRTLRINHKEGMSHRHGAQILNIKDHTIATIKMPLAVMCKSLGHSNNLPNKKK